MLGFSADDLLGTIMANGVISSHTGFDTTRMFAAMILRAIVGTALFFIVASTEGAVIPWHVSRRRFVSAWRGPRGARIGDHAERQQPLRDAGRKRVQADRRGRR